MTWNTFWTEYASFIQLIGQFLSSFPGIIVTMILAPMLFAIMYGFIHMLRGLRP